MIVLALSKLRAALSSTFVAMLLALWLAAPAAAATDAASPAAKSPLTVCENQTYALCLTAQCFVFDGVSYCKCDVKSLTQKPTFARVA